MPVTYTSEREPVPKLHDWSGRTNQTHHSHGTVLRCRDSLVDEDLVFCSGKHSIGLDVGWHARSANHELRTSRSSLGHPLKYTVATSPDTINVARNIIQIIKLGDYWTSQLATTL